MTVTRAVIVTLSISLLGLLFVGADGLWGLLQSQKRSQYVENNTYPAIQALTDVRSSLNGGRIATFLHASTFQAAQKARIGQQIAAYDMAMDHALAAYRNTLVSGVTDSAMLASDRAAWSSYRSERELMLEKSANNDTAAAHKLLTTTLADRATSLDTALSTHIAYNNKLAAALSLATTEAFATSIRTLVIAIAVGFLLISSLTMFLLRIIRSSGYGIERTLERTRELREAQTALLATARQAGMAEIANNVLHNVGNVLNSVNVSAGLISSMLRESKVQGLTKAVQLMNEHATDLSDFFNRNDKGKLLPGYLNKLAVALAMEQQGIVEELRSLTKGIEHINDIVATQQSYSGVASLLGEVQMQELLEDALRLNADALTRHLVVVTRNFANVPLLMLDKSRLLQILVNLIRNATQAMDGIVDRAHQITLRMSVADLADEPRLIVQIEDNGEGIARENLPQLFVHGFTTRKTGHGFGLHSCVLAAQEMGGTLAAHSDGQGKGATFTLDLPAKPSHRVDL
jgi:signal transduction histidine kinase